MLNLNYLSCHTWKQGIYHFGDHVKRKLKITRERSHWPRMGKFEHQKEKWPQKTEIYEMYKSLRVPNDIPSKN